MNAELGPGAHTRIRRQPAMARYDEATVYAILDAAPFAHVAGVVDGRAVSLATLIVREGRRLYIHGSPSNALFRAVVASGEACVSAAIFDGLRLARSGFESSVAYRSVVAFGSVHAVGDPEASRALAMFVERSLPGRAAELRAMTDAERRLTSVVAFDIEEASAKISSGPTDDSDDDQQLPLWSGVVPARVEYGAPVPSFDGAMADGTILPPPSLRRLAEVRGPERMARVREQIEHLEPVDSRERVSIDALRDRLAWSGDPFDEAADPRHLTASAFIVSPRGIVLHRHKVLGIWVQPGGHVDLDETPEAAAVREAVEETGLAVRLREGGIVHVDVHQGPRGHTHYDLRYLLDSDGEDPHPAPGESPDVAWFSFEEAARRAEPSLVPVLAKLSQLDGRRKDGTLAP